jgi:hypothetical protein
MFLQEPKHRRRHMSAVASDTTPQQTLSVQPEMYHYRMCCAFASAWDDREALRALWVTPYLGSDEPQLEQRRK